MKILRIKLKIGFDAYARRLAAAPKELVKEIEHEIIFAAEAFAGYAKKDVSAQSFDVLLLFLKKNLSETDGLMAI